MTLTVSPPRAPDAGGQEPQLPPRPSRRRLRVPCRGHGWECTARGLSLAVALYGVLAMLAWYAHWTVLLRPRPGQTPMVFTTALWLALAGTGGVLATTRRPRSGFAVRLIGLVIGTTAVVVVIETLTKHSLGIDQLFVRAYLRVPGHADGLPSLNTTVCVLVIAAAFALGPPQGRLRVTQAWSVAALIVFATSAVALFGYAAGIDYATAWHSTQMSLPTAVCLTVLAAGLLAGALGTREKDGHPAAEWVAVGVSVFIFAVVALFWQALTSGDRNELVPASAASEAAFVLMLLTGCAIVLVAWLLQRANRLRHLAEEMADELRAEVVRRIEAERVARGGERLAYQFLDALPVGVAVNDAKGHPRFVNAVGQKLLGRGVERVTGHDDLAIRYGVVVAGTDEPYPLTGWFTSEEFRSHGVHRDDVEVVRDDGSRIPVEGWARPIFGDDRRVTYSLLAFVDITARRTAERELRRKSALLDLAGDAIYMRDSNGIITYWNRGAERRYGWSSAEAVGRDAAELLRTEMSRPLAEILDELRRVGHWQGDAVQYARDGRQIHVVAQLVAEFGAHRAIDSTMVINTDVTQLRTAQQELHERAVELQKLNREYERSNEDLKQFAYAASHDLSEPLRAISGSVSLIARRYEGQLGPDADTFIGFAVDGCARMQTLIDDLLRFSRVGRVNAEMGCVDLGHVLRDVQADLSEAIAERHATIHVGDLPTVVGCRSELHQVFQNLISNATKFARPGIAPVVEVQAARAGDEWRFTVSDNGIGIEPQHRDRVFGMFKRLHARDEYPGTGIGLALAKKIVERHGGAIGVSDGPGGEGTTFWFTLPERRDPECATSSPS